MFFWQSLKNVMLFYPKPAKADFADVLEGKMDTRFCL